VTSLTPSATGSSVTFTATISPSAATGSVEFFDGATSLGVQPVGGGQVVISTSSLTVGSHPITAVYGGNGDYSGSTSASVTQVVDTPALADAYSVLKDGTLSVGSPGVLGNDGDVDAGQTLTALLVSGPANSAAFILNADGSFNYTPTAGFTGLDSFSYQATDGVIPADARTVTIAVLAPTATPVAENDAYSVTTNTPLTVTGPGVLANDNGQDMTAVPVSAPAH
jgi:hypothetical protein